MQYEISATEKYIDASFSGNGDLNYRATHTNELIALSDITCLYKILVDASDLDSRMEPVDFFSLGKIYSKRNLTGKLKIAIVCKQSKQLYNVSKYKMEKLGVVSKVFESRTSAVHWLL